MKTMMVRGAVSGVLVLGLVSMTAGCTGASGGNGGSTGSGASAGAGSSEAGRGSSEGTRESVSVASFILPKGPTWEATPKTVESDVEEAFWTTVDAKTGKNICRISLSVQSQFPNDKESYRILLQGMGESFKGSEDDPAAPKGGWGLIARFAGGTAAGASPFTSVTRTWVTPGKTKMTLGVTVIDGQEAVCDTQKITDTLQWDGQEVAVSSPSA